MQSMQPPLIRLIEGAALLVRFLHCKLNCDLEYSIDCSVNAQYRLHKLFRQFIKTDVRLLTSIAYVSLSKQRRSVQVQCLVYTDQYA
jgi:hypothetical protein